MTPVEWPGHASGNALKPLLLSQLGRVANSAARPPWVAEDERRKCADFEIIELSSFVLPKRAGPVARMERRDIRGGGPTFRRCAPPCGLRILAEIIGFFRLALFCQLGP
jgi:hypothetical protein